jgi:hypothetical protein
MTKNPGSGHPAGATALATPGVPFGIDPPFILHIPQPAVNSLPFFVNGIYCMQKSLSSWPSTVKYTCLVYPSASSYDLIARLCHIKGTLSRG